MNTRIEVNESSLDRFDFAVLYFTLVDKLAETVKVINIYSYVKGDKNIYTYTFMLLTTKVGVFVAMPV